MIAAATIVSADARLVRVPADALHSALDGRSLIEGVRAADRILPPRGPHRRRVSSPQRC
jgi:hypothetical protein